MAARAEFGHGVGTAGVRGIPEHLGDIFSVICENTGSVLRQNRAGSPDIAVYSPQTWFLFVCFFFSGILFLTNRTL